MSCHFPFPHMIIMCGMTFQVIIDNGCRSGNQGQFLCHISTSLLVIQSQCTANFHHLSHFSNVSGTTVLTHITSLPPGRLSFWESPCICTCRCIKSGIQPVKKWMRYLTRHISYLLNPPLPPLLTKFYQYPHHNE